MSRVRPLRAGASVAARAWSCSRGWLVPALVFLAIVLAMFFRLWTPLAGGRRTFGWDAVWQYWGDLQFQYDAWRDGELPLWNPFDRAGYPFHADPQAGVLYPFNWALLAIAALAGRAAYWLVSVKIVFHFWLAGLGTYAFLRRRGLPEAACYAGGIALILSYPFIHNVFSALNWSFAWAPWALRAVDAWAQRPSVGRGAAFGLVVGMSFLAGAPAGFWYGLLVVVPYGVWAALHHGRRATPRRAWLREAARSGAVAVLVFFGLAAAQLDATPALVAASVRGQRTLDWIAFSTFSAEDVMSFFFPAFPRPSENTYLGMGVILWGAALLTTRPTARHLVLAGIALAGIVNAWGQHMMVLPLEASLLPPFGLFRRAHRYLYVTALPVAILGAEGLAELFRLEEKQLRRRMADAVVAAGAIGLVICGVGYASRMEGVHDQTDRMRDAFALGFAAVLATTWVTRQLLVQDGRLRSAFLTLAVVALALDLQLARAHVIDRNLVPLPKGDRDAQLLTLDRVASREVRVYNRAYFQHRPGTRLGVRDLGGYEDDPLALARYVSLRNAVSNAPKNLGHANVGWIAEDANMVTIDKARPDQRVHLEAAGQGLYRVRNPAPFAYCVDAAIVSPDLPRARQALLRTAPGTAVSLEADQLTEEEARIAAQGSLDTPASPGRILRYERRRVEVEVPCPAQDNVILVSEAFYPSGWSATVDGAPARIFPANVLFRGVLARGAGPHRVVMEYRAPRYAALAAVALATLVGALALVLRSALAQRERNP